MRIAGGEKPIAGFEVGMVKGELNEVAGETFAAVWFINPNVAEVSEAGAIGDDTEEGGLSAAMESAEDKGGVFGGAFDAFERDARGPIGGGQPGMDARPIDAGGVGGELVVAESGRCRWWRVLL